MENYFAPQALRQHLDLGMWTGVTVADGVGGDSAVVS
jgi:hypothetical protein